MREDGRRAASLDLLSLEYLADAGACVLGTPDDCIEACRRYEEAGVDLLLCLVNPYQIPHEKVMQTIELFGTHVIPRSSRCAHPSSDGVRASRSSARSSPRPGPT